MAYYCLKYSTKSQNKTEKELAMYIDAFNKAVSKPDNSAKKMILSMMIHLNQYQEIASPLASLYILNNSSVYYSHKFINVYIHTILSMLWDNQTEIVFRQSKSKYTTSSLLFDYIHRPNEFNNTCLHEYVSSYEKKNSAIWKRAIPSIPVIVGKAIQPDCIDD